MNWITAFDQEALDVWHNFVKQEQLTEHQADQFGQYLTRLIEFSKKTNLTTITSIPLIISDHFQDSLHLGHTIPMTAELTLCDIGSGAGFPGIPLAIKYPEIQMILLEVNNKKVAFLQMIIDELGLTNCSIDSSDFRLLLRHSSLAIDYFLARASLKPAELMRIFSPHGAYHTATVVYWASRYWEPTSKELKYLYRQEPYVVDAKERRLIFFAVPK